MIYRLLTTLQMARLVTVLRLDGGNDTVTVYSVKDFPYDSLDTKAMKCNNKRKCAEYLQTFGAYDIETTTTFKGKAPDWVVAPWAFMYHWQMDVGGYLIVGRTWDEWLEFLTGWKKCCNLIVTNSLLYMFITSDTSSSLCGTSLNVILAVLLYLQVKQDSRSPYRQDEGYSLDVVTS